MVEKSFCLHVAIQGDTKKLVIIFKANLKLYYTSRFPLLNFNQFWNKWTYEREQTFWTEDNSFLKWQPCYFLVIAIFFAVNTPTVLLMFFNKFASCSIPFFNLFLFFNCGRPSFGFEQFRIVHLYVEAWKKYFDLVWSKLGRSPSTIK